MTNLEWMKQEGYELRRMDVIHDRKSGNILFVANKIDENGFINSYGLFMTRRRLHLPSGEWEMSVGFADWLQSERKPEKIFAKLDVYER